MDPAIGKKVQDYQIVSLLGTGGMGNVYLAQHPLIGKKVAVKILRPEYTDDKEILGRFFHEAKAVNDIQHENVVDILNFVSDEANNNFFILMEYLDGQTLADAIDAEAPLSPKKIGHVALQICSGLAAAHSKGIIHRDLKSDNIFLITRAGQRDFVKLLDFGLAKLQESPHQQISKAGIALGTPAYMSPEQAAGDPIDARTDIYSLGVILYEAATRTLPFTDTTNQNVMRKHLFAALPKPSERYPNIDPRLEAVIIRCMEKEADNRYQSMRDVALDLAVACGLDPSPYLGGVLTSQRVSTVPKEDNITTREEPLPEDFLAGPTDPNLPIIQIPDTKISPLPIERGSDSMPAIEIQAQDQEPTNSDMKRWLILGGLAMMLFLGGFIIVSMSLAPERKSLTAKLPSVSKQPSSINATPSSIFVDPNKNAVDPTKTPIKKTPPTIKTPIPKKTTPMVPPKNLRETPDPIDGFFPKKSPTQ
jgi:serine/threonine protein kinase